MAATTANGRGVVTLSGVEPQLRWRTFCDHVLGVAVAVGARTVVTLGALLAEVPHSRPVSVFGTAYDDDDAAVLDLLPSRYEGPTGITGVLHAACHDLGIRSAAFWAAVPTYVPSAPSPKAALALVQRTSRLLDTTVDLTELQFATDAYEHQVSELVAEDEETTDYVAHLEQRYDDRARELQRRREPRRRGRALPPRPGLSPVRAGTSRSCIALARSWIAQARRPVVVHVDRPARQGLAGQLAPLVDPDGHRRQVVEGEPPDVVWSRAGGPSARRRWPGSGTPASRAGSG